MMGHQLAPTGLEPVAAGYTYKPKSSTVSKLREGFNAGAVHHYLLINYWIFSEERSEA